MRRLLSAKLPSSKPSMSTSYSRQHASAFSNSPPCSASRTLAPASSEAGTLACDPPRAPPRGFRIAAESEAPCCSAGAGHVGERVSRRGWRRCERHFLLLLCAAAVDCRPIVWDERGPSRHFRADVSVRRFPFVCKRMALPREAAWAWGWSFRTLLCSDARSLEHRRSLGR